MFEVVYTLFLLAIFVLIFLILSGLFISNKLGLVESMIFAAIIALIGTIFWPLTFVLVIVAKIITKK